LNIGQKSKVLAKIEIIVKNRAKRSKFWCEKKNFNEKNIFAENLRGQSSWHIIMVNYQCNVPRTFATQIWQIFTKNRFFVKNIFSHRNFDVFPSFRFLTKIPILAKKFIF